jgi:hypothetical protein
VFVGYGLDEFEYWFFDPVKRKLIRSRDVVFTLQKKLLFATQE